MAKPDILSVEWNDWIMSQFDESELDNGYPKVEGMRRLLELHVAQIVDSCVKTFAVTDKAVTVIYEICVYINKDKVIYSDIADCTDDNCHLPYSKYKAAIAATRAEARCLRKILKLKTVAAEELENFAQPLDKVDEVDTISTNQTDFIKSKCSNLGINVEKLIADSIDILDKVEVLEKLSRTGAGLLMKKITGYINDKKSIPDKIKV